MTKANYTFKDQSHKYYFDHPVIWEGLRRHSIEKEIDFLKYIFSDHGRIKKVLDVGCGTGLHAYHLTKLGYQTVGVDLNPHMISYAKNHYPESKFYIADMRTLDTLHIKDEFDVVLCLCTTFTYNLTMKEIMVTLKNFYKILSKSGILIIEIFNPISFLEKNRFEGSFFLEDEGLYRTLDLRVDVYHSIDERRQILLEVKKVYSFRNDKLLKKDQTEFRLLFPQEIRFYLQQSGFAVIEQYGRYDINYTTLDRTRLITIARKF